MTCCISGIPEFERIGEALDGVEIRAEDRFDYSNPALLVNFGGLRDAGTKHFILGRVSIGGGRSRRTHQEAFRGELLEARSDGAFTAPDHFIDGSDAPFSFGRGGDEEEDLELLHRLNMLPQELANLRRDCVASHCAWS